MQAGYKGVITQFGRVRDVVDPGLEYVNPLSEKIIMVDMRTITHSLPPQEVMTLDQLPCTVVGDVLFRRVNPVRATFGVASLDYSIDQLSMNALRLVMRNKAFLCFHQF